MHEIDFCCFCDKVFQGTTANKGGFMPERYTALMNITYVVAFLIMLVCIVVWIWGKDLLNFSNEIAQPEGKRFYKVTSRKKTEQDVQNQIYDALYREGIIGLDIQKDYIKENGRDRVYAVFVFKNGNPAPILTVKVSLLSELPLECVWSSSISTVQNDYSKSSLEPMVVGACIRQVVKRLKSISS